MVRETGGEAGLGGDVSELFMYSGMKYLSYEPHSCHLIDMEHSSNVTSALVCYVCVHLCAQGSMALTRITCRKAQSR